MLSYMGTITEAYDLRGYGFAYVYEVLFPEVSLCIITMITTHLYLNCTSVFGTSEGNQRFQ